MSSIQGRRLRGVSISSSATLALVVGIALATPAAAVRAPGGGSPRTDCYAEFEVAGASAGDGRVQCADGDPSCDTDGVCNDSCSFQVAVCANQSDVAGCTAPAVLTSIAPVGLAKRLGVQAPAVDSSACGAFVDVPVPVRVGRHGKKAGRVTLRAVAVSPTRPKRDRDQVRLECLPCGTKAAAFTCRANPAGPEGPNELRLVVPSQGSDLDNGWSGISHNFPLVGGSTLDFCLSGCDGHSDPTCEAHGATGPGTLNGPMLGPPLPLFAAGLPVCITNRFRDASIDGVANLATGEISADVNLLSDVFLTNPVQVCPQCTGGDIGGRGVCDGGAAAGHACTVEGTVVVSGSNGAKTYHVSSTCRPDDSPQGTLKLELPLTTATSTLDGSKPCQAAGGVPSRDNGCPSGRCGSACTGTACVAKTADGECIDVKGGVSQLCCDDDTSSPCFPTSPADAGRIERVGTSTSPAPAWPEASYPKTSAETLVATFCEPATDSPSLNTVTGLPGPGALVMPVAACWGTPSAGCP